MSAPARHTSHEITGLRGKALSAAAHILASRGADELNLRAIATHAKIGIGSIYYYFANKDELLLSLALMGFDDLRREILSSQAEPDAPSPMRAASRAFLGFAARQPATFSLMFNERLLTRHQSLRQAERSILSLYEAAVQADDRIPPPHQGEAAAALWALGRGVAAMMASEPTGTLPPEVLERIIAGARYLIDHHY